VAIERHASYAPDAISGKAQRMEQHERDPGCLPAGLPGCRQNGLPDGPPARLRESHVVRVAVYRLHPWR
jgi:hypothetical protein